MKVKAFAVNIGGRKGYDLIVSHEAASVQDYLDALNELIEKGNLHRSRASVSTCEGCPGCCNERIPLTSVDIKNLMRAEEVSLGQEDSYNKVLGCYSQVIVEDRAVDIILGSNSVGNCLFLDQQQGKCRIYQWRPLVCQTFICAPSSLKAKNLRETVVNQGEDQLVREWLLEAQNRGIPPVIHLGDDPNPVIEDWEKTVFNGKNHYNQILLKDICAPSLWEELFR